MEKDLFGELPQRENDWEEHYKDMPEYNNEEKPPPLITAKFKFRCTEDFEHFKKVVKEHLYDGNRVFDGMQKKDKKQAWYPLPPRPSKYKYIDE